MATHAYLICNNKAIYIHNDGYPEHTLTTLQNHYNTKEKLEELFKLGDLSFLGSKLYPDKNSEHSFDEPCDDVTIAYHRDRGEDYHLLYLNNKNDFIKENPYYVDYIYEFIDDVWIQQR